MRTSMSMVALCLLGAACPAAERREINYDESKMPPYTLPDPLLAADGQPVTTPDQWLHKRRPEIFRMFQEQMFGRAPGRPKDLKFVVRSVARDALGGIATRKQVSILFAGKNDGPKMDLLLYLPNAAFPHWFCGNFRQYSNRESELPFDQHMLIALIAPRPVYVTSAEEDKWADPKGEFLAAKNAHSVYRLLGADGMAASDMPPIEQPVFSTIGYHIRRGKHDVTDYDWRQWMTFADKHWKR